MKLVEIEKHTNTTRITPRYQSRARYTAGEYEHEYRDW